MLSRWQPSDVVVLTLLVGLMALKATGRDGTVDDLIVIIAAGYIGWHTGRGNHRTDRPA